MGNERGNSSITFTVFPSVFQMFGVLRAEDRERESKRQRERERKKEMKKGVKRRRSATIFTFDLNGLRSNEMKNETRTIGITMLHQIIKEGKEWDTNNGCHLNNLSLSFYLSFFLSFSLSLSLFSLSIFLHFYNSLSKSTLKREINFNKKFLSPFLTKTG